MEKRYLIKHLTGLRRDLRPERAVNHFLEADLSVVIVSGDKGQCLGLVSVSEARVSACVLIYSRMLFTLPFSSAMSKTQ
jgi:hypothetical protein